jgi:hypothetical protein
VRTRVVLTMLGALLLLAMPAQAAGSWVVRAEMSCTDCGSKDRVVTETTTLNDKPIRSSKACLMAKAAVVRAGQSNGLKVRARCIQR